MKNKFFLEIKKKAFVLIFQVISLNLFSQNNVHFSLYEDSQLQKQ